MIQEEEKIFDYLNGFSSDEEKQKVDNWVSLSDSNKKEFDKIKQIHKLSAIDVESHNLNVDEAWSTVSDKLFSDNTKRLKIEKQSSSSFQLGVFYRIAAVLVLAVGIAYFMMENEGVDSFDLEYHTKAGEMKEFVLADGTEVVLNENTIFKYSDQFVSDKRVVFLEGEAFFNVAKDELRPFTIESPTASTRVLGTSFNLIAKSKNAKIDVFSGKVEFGVLAKSGNKVVLTKGQSASFIGGITSATQSINTNSDSWKTGQLKFENTSMTRVVLALKKLYKVEITLDKSIANCSITSTFDNDSLKEVLAVIETIAQIKSTKKDGVIHLSGSGC